MEQHYMHSADGEDDVVDDTTDQHRRPGQKQNERILYLPAHPKSFTSDSLVATINFPISSVAFSLALTILISENSIVHLCCSY